MFFFSITKDEIAQKFQSRNIEQFKTNLFVMTIITDNFLSKLIIEPNGFSIIESPIISNPDFPKIIFSEVKYNNNGIIKISKSTISGRPIFYYLTQKGEFFCSTHISMLRKTGIKIEENIDVLPEFFVYRLVMPPHTLYKNIYRLPMGGRLYINISNGKCKIQSLDHFILPQKNANIKSIRECAQQLIKYYYNSFERNQSYKRYGRW